MRQSPVEISKTLNDHFYAGLSDLTSWFSSAITLFSSTHNNNNNNITRISVSACCKATLPDSPSAGSSSGCCTSLCQSKAPPRACPGSPGLCTLGRLSRALSWMLASCRWTPSGRTCSAFWGSAAARCSSPPAGCWCRPTGCSTGRKTLAAACEDSGSGSVGKKKTQGQVQIYYKTFYKPGTVFSHFVDFSLGSIYR